MQDTLASNKGFKQLFITVFICCVSVACSVNNTADIHESTSVPTQSKYQPSSHPMLDVQNALNTAKEQNKLLLVVMGAQWCHDSKGFVEKFEHQDLAIIINDNYHTTFVDVGNFNNLTSITQRFDQAHYFATPTVMIINPHTERLVNANDMHIWGNADSLPLAQYISYFDTYANDFTKNTLPAHKEIPAKHIVAIKAFEHKNVIRLNAAYALLSPSMAQDREHRKGDLFITQWREIRAYRTSLQKDIQKLRQQAILAPNRTLLFPSYPKFSWEE